MPITPWEILHRAGLAQTNIMTPDIVSVHLLNADSAAELSKGYSFDGVTPIWGVTVVWHGARDFDKSTLFFNEDEALQYIYALSL